MPVTILLTYFVVLYLIPKYLRERKYTLFILYGLYTIIVSFVAIILSVFYGLVFSSYLKDVDSAVLTKSIPLIVLGIYFVVGVAMVISLFVYSFLSSLKNEDLKNKFLETQLQLKQQELKFLKMQIHPHFLFNSLNTIYGYALKKADEAPEMILKLSNLLDYILYQTDKPQVSLENELDHIEDYIALEKIRFHDTLQVTFSRGEVNSPIAVAPMLLIPFVENSFKHGAILDGVLKVDIEVDVANDQLHFNMSNSIQKTDDSTPGIGLENIRKRLEMLYPNNYELKIEKVDHRFTVGLKVQLKEL
jgi:LytS/YehU family sensor histidine kinase